MQKTEGVDRAESKFEEDTSQHPYFRSRNSDYKYRLIKRSGSFGDLPCYSGFDRGHMAPAGNHRKDQAMCNQTFLLSNMAPQVTTVVIKVMKVLVRWGRASIGTNGRIWNAM